MESFAGEKETVRETAGERKTESRARRKSGKGGRQKEGRGEPIYYSRINPREPSPKKQRKRVNTGGGGEEEVTEHDRDLICDSRYARSSARND